MNRPTAREELTAPPPARTSISTAVIELLFRYGLGDFNATVRRRLSDIFSGNPDDAMTRLERAAVYLGITGAGMIDAMKRSDEADEPDELESTR